MISTVSPVTVNTTDNAPGKNWTPGLSVALVAIIAAVALVEWLAPLRLGAATGRVAAWLATMLLLGAFGAVVGQGITGVWWGVLIDQRNRLSLSRLQIALWTVVVLSAYLTVILANLDHAISGLSVTIPGTILTILGISATSALGAPLILSTKAAKPADPVQLQHTTMMLQQQGVDVSSVAARGQIVYKRDSSAADWSDLFKGEETGNAAQIDLGKIQLFYFTLILAGTYAVAVGKLLHGSTTIISALPDLDQSVLVLLGISHAGYLTSKVLPNSLTPGGPPAVPVSVTLPTVSTSDSPAPADGASASSPSSPTPGA